MFSLQSSKVGQKGQNNNLYLSILEKADIKYRKVFGYKCYVMCFKFIHKYINFILTLTINNVHKI